KHRITPLIVIAYLLFFMPYQSWVVFLYTESAYFSLILILFSVLVLDTSNILQRRDDVNKAAIIRTLLLTGLVVLLVIISRPLGILFAGSVYMYVLYCASKRWKIILGICSALMLLLGYFVINAVFSSIHDWTITQAFEQESIICDMPVESRYPKPILATDGTPVYHLWFYLTHNFSHFLHFAGVKLKYFFMMTRPYYSNGHNLFLLVNLIPVYLLGSVGLFLRQIKFAKGICFFMLTSILLYALTIMFQCDDYHNRFVLSIFPFFVILAAVTVEYFVLRLFKHHK
ncbi:MAG TPA: hypothetical protein VKH37_12025, partial [Ferruginibacter sp.]|nr:hypothetical protein [Ferruginibacter sp.]